ncbi:MAG: amino acid ABC transporter permease [Chloroflexota bacterium]
MSISWLTPDMTSLLLRGLWLTISLTLLSSILSLIVGIGTATLRTSRKRWLRVIGTLHVEIHRNIPALVLILFWAFAVPNLFPIMVRQELFFANPIIRSLESITGLSLIYYAFAVTLALTLNTSAYIAEIFRAAVGTLPREHVDSAKTLGASAWQSYWSILLPQGLRVAMPAIATRLVHNMKNTSLASFVSVPELFHSTQTGITRSFRAFEFLLLAAAIYLILSCCFAEFLRWCANRL